MKLFIKIFLILSLSFAYFSSYAVNSQESFTGVTMESTVDIPWMNCTEKDTVSGGTDAETTIYTCNVEKGFSSMLTMVSGMIKYFTYIALVAAVLFIVINGIMYSMSGVDSGMKDEAKKRITKTLIGIILLLLSGYLLNLFFPWIYT